MIVSYVGGPKTEVHKQTQRGPKLKGTNKHNSVEEWLLKPSQEKAVVNEVAFLIPQHGPKLKDADKHNSAKN